MEGMHNRKLFDLLVSWVLAYFVIIGALLLVCVAVTIALIIGASWTVTVAAALLAAAPAVALPFSARAAKWLLLLAYSGLAAVFVWLAFWPRPGAASAPLVKGVVVAFAALLVVRLCLAWRSDRKARQH
ncbi:hypothetical protein [Stenotrophomonas sp.]|uniref:hypothetical protein n=1 Tax=Stenotrophomonas sp. TaxID=69392 RepID=UPI0029B7CED5|nr:hypothetical protein [Stenotrophomonas sp.]MDX3935469.1 hypothetical protein [Stenotrophomonas sp.]